MKLPRLRRKPAPETAEPAGVGPAAPVLQVVIYSNTDLPEHEFMAQTEKLRRVASFDNATRSWHGQIPFDRPEWAAEMLTALFDVARLHGTDIRVQTPPASEDSPSGQELCPAGTSASGRGSAARPIRAWLQRVTTGAARRLSPWTGTWTGVRGIPSAIFPFTGRGARRRCW
jgi:hypothetical protein